MIIRTMIILLLSISTVYAKDSISSLDTEINQAFSAHFKKYKQLEYFSGAELSIYLPNQPIKNYYLGQVTQDKASKKVSSETLFQIGSITKSFTAALILQLEKEGKLNLDDTLRIWLPQYPKWSTVTIKTLLNMSSGLPNYSDTPAMNVQVANNLSHQWSKEELINYVYPASSFSPPLKSGYFYTNTGYILADLISEKATHHNFQNELVNRTIQPADLHNTFYPVPTMENTIHDRMAHGYNYNQYDNPVLVGKDIYDNDLSWAGAAGAIVSNSEDVIKWVKALFIDNTILDAMQKQKLQSLISLQTGKPIKQTNKNDPRGFGLGVVQAFDDHDPLLKQYWFYQGETLGFRAVYFYNPCNGIMISSIFNSSTNSENDHIGELMKKINKIILKHYSQLICK